MGDKVKGGTVETEFLKMPWSTFVVTLTASFLRKHIGIILTAAFLRKETLGWFYL